jgi:hypothetical protein
LDVSAAQKLLKDDSFVVLRVPSAVEQSGGASGDGFFQESQERAVVFQFGLISSFEFGPFDWIVSEPLPELRAGGDLFEPEVDLGPLFGQTTRPEAVDEHAGTVLLGWFFVDALES